MKSQGSTFDIGHLCFLPVDAPGSVNRSVGRQIRGLAEFRHLCIGYDSLLAREREDSGFVVVPGAKYRVARRVLRCLPGRLREWHFGVESVDHVLWLRRAKEILRAHRPPVIVSHDHYKLGEWLRGWVDWPCRFILKQHGFAYFGEAVRSVAVTGFQTVVFLNESSYRYCMEHSHDLSAAVEIIPNGVDTNLFHPPDRSEREAARKKLGFEDDAVIVGTVGRQVPKKGAHILMRAWPDVKRKCPKAVLLIVGRIAPYEYETEIQALLKWMGPDAGVHVEGQVERGEVAKILGACDVFAFPSLCHEGMPQALLEALSTGLVCVASRRTEVEEMCSGVFIHWVDRPNFPDEWAQAIISGIGAFRNNQRRPHDQWEWVRRKYHESDILERWRTFYAREIDLARCMA